MKVVQINAVCGYGSTGKICVEISEYMNEKNIENYIFYSDKTSDFKNASKLNSKLDVKIHGLFSRITGMQGYFSKGHTKKIISEIKRIKPDIVHLHNLHGNYIHLNMLLDYLAKNDIATVITLHDCWFFTGKCMHYKMMNCYKWQTGCYKCPQLKNGNKSWFFDRTKKMWKDKKEHLEKIPRLGVIGVSDWITEQGKNSLLKNAKIIKRIYNWVDLDAFYPQNENVKEKYNIPNNKFIILMIGAGWNINSDKFKDALKLSEMLDSNMQIVIVGNGLKNVSVPKNITKIEYIDGKDELAKVYSNADVYVHVSGEDTFGKVVVEAMACGTPAIVYDSTALPELIGENCGYVVLCEDVEAIYDKIKLVKENGKKFYSDNCVEYVRENFEKNKLIDETIELYKKL